jgi:hypothetical protein
MGQKITEHPAADQWVKLMREVDRTGATSHLPYTRKAVDAHEWEKYGVMQRARTRTIAGYESLQGPIQAGGLTYCVGCDMIIGDLASAFHKRTTYPANGEPVRSYLCPTCAGRKDEA